MPAPLVPPAPAASSSRVRSQMVGQARRDTACEVAVRRALHSRGLRFRVHQRVLPELRREADVLFRKARVAVFVDGCFWHGCALHKAPVHRNGEWWRQKLTRTAIRDRETDLKLIAAGWTVIRVWEHTDPEEAATVIAQVLRAERNPHATVI